MGRARRQKDMTDPFDLEKYYAKSDYIAGIDEAGWGPIAGPLWAAAVVLPRSLEVPSLIKDSKKLSRSQIAEAVDWITENSFFYSCLCTSVGDKPANNPATARNWLFRQVSKYSKIAVPNSYTIIDGCYYPLTVPGEALIKGDVLVPAISAASILAKYNQIMWMESAETKYPGFSFSKHRGYATKLHREELKRLGKTPVHRENTTIVKNTSKIYNEDTK